MRVIKSRRLSWTGHAARVEKVGVILILTDKPTRKILFGRPRYRWENNIRMDLEIGTRK